MGDLSEPEIFEKGNHNESYVIKETSLKDSSLLIRLLVSSNHQRNLYVARYSTEQTCRAAHFSQSVIDLLFIY